MDRRYLITIVLVLLPGVLLLVLSAAFLLRLGEFVSLDSVVDRQQGGEAFCRYQGNRGDEIQYKSGNYAARTPDIVALGSSRVLQFRERFFMERFYNAGIGQSTSAERFSDWVSHLLSLHTPKYVIIGIDHWWFNERESQKIEPFAEGWNESQPRIQPRYFAMVIEKVWKGKIAMSDFLSVIFSGSKREYCTIGQEAYLRHSGYSPDGSYYYGTKLVDAKFPKETPVFRSTQARMRLNQHEAVFDAASWQEFVVAVDTLRDRGIEVLVILPPMAPMIYVQMMDPAHDYLYIEELRSRLASLDVPFVDTMDALAYGSTDCEFPDGRHGGDVTYARILEKVYQEQPHWRSRIAIEEVRAVMAKSRGLKQDFEQRVPQQDDVQCPKE